MDQNGSPVSLVNVMVEIMPRTGDLLVTRPVRLLNVRENLELRRSPEDIDLLLSGPLPLLREIEANPELVQVTLDASIWRQDKQEMTPQVVAPEGIQIQLVPETVLVSRVKKE
ncbi:MAG: hypothetical protein M5U34_14575 [Chloroflexi bacterium]|nr:hypothetical protein [Chloroflexota bacterium]